MLDTRLRVYRWIMPSDGDVVCGCLRVASLEDGKTDGMAVGAM